MTVTARHRRLALAAYVTALFAITLAPLPSPVAALEALPLLDRLAGVLDKAVHALLFGGLTLLLFWDAGWRVGYEGALRAMGLAIGLAALVELVQAPLPYRHGDPLDFAAGGLGALLAAAAVLALTGGRARRTSEDGPTA